MVVMLLAALTPALLCRLPPPPTDFLRPNDSPSPPPPPHHHHHHHPSPPPRPSSLAPARSLIAICPLTNSLPAFPLLRHLRKGRRRRELLLLLLRVLLLRVDHRQPVLCQPLRLVIDASISTCLLLICLASISNSETVGVAITLSARSNRLVRSADHPSPYAAPPPPSPPVAAPPPPPPSDTFAHSRARAS